MKATPRHALFLLALSATLVGTFYICLLVWGNWHDEWSGYNASLRVSDGRCNIAIVPISGDIFTFDSEEGTGADEVLSLLHRAEQDPHIVGVLVRIDSYGGSLVASQMLANAFKHSPLPIAALIRESGTSGAYLSSTGADTIIASPFSDVGGIGVTMSYVENWQKNLKEGLSYVSLTSAPFKDYGNPDRPLSSTERSLLLRDLEVWHEQFVKEISENRKLDIEDVKKLADGSSLPAALALEHQLIDSIGDEETAREWFASQVNLSLKETRFCE